MEKGGKGFFRKGNRGPHALACASFMFVRLYENNDRLKIGGKQDEEENLVTLFYFLCSRQSVNN